MLCCTETGTRFSFFLTTFTSTFWKQANGWSNLSTNTFIVCCNDQVIYVSYLYLPFSVTFLPSLQLHKQHLTSTCFLSSGPFNPVMQHFLWGACKLTFNILMTKFLYVCQTADGSMNLCIFELFLSVNICADTVVTSKTKYLHSL